VRSEPEFAAAHAAGAVNVPIMNMTSAGMSNNPAFVAVMLGAYAKDAKLVVGCKAGSRSLRAAELLREAGFVGIVEHRAGFDGARGPFGQAAEQGWSAAGLPVERGEAPGRSYADIKAKAGL
jgi:rhodanese-related sulfurtransferase